MNDTRQQTGICIVAESFYPNLDGGAVYARLLAEQFSAHRRDVFIVTRRNTPDYPSHELLSGVPVYRVGPDDRLGILGRYLAMISVCVPLVKNRKNYDLVLVSNLRILGAPVLILARLLGKKCAVRTDSCGELSGSYAVKTLSPYSLKRLLVVAYFRLRNSILRKADAFIAISNDVAREFRAEKIPDSHIRLIPNGVDTDRYSPVDKIRKIYLRSQFGLPEYDLVFAYSGRLTREKGLDVLMRVWGKLAARFQAIHLVFIGTGHNMPLSCENELRLYVKQHCLERCVTFAGSVNTVAEYLQCADVFMFPSRTEALGLALIEAQSCGLPAIGANVGGIPDIIEHNVNGILVEPDNEKQLYDAAVSLVSDGRLRADMGSAGRQVVLEKFALENITESYLNLFNDVVHGYTGGIQLINNGKMDGRDHV